MPDEHDRNSGAVRAAALSRGNGLGSVALAVSIPALIAVFAFLAVQTSIGNALISLVLIGAVATLGVMIRRRVDRG